MAEYGYDGLNRRIVKKIYDSGTLDETRHCYYSDRAQCLEERIDSSTDAAVQYLWGIRFVDDLVLRDRDTNGDGTLDERLYALCDPRFSIIAITDNSGTVQERYGYDGYGSTSIYSSSYVPRVSSNFAWECWPTPAYDDNGNTTAMPQPANLTSSYDATWDAWNRLVKLQDGSDTVAEYGYDGLNRRIIKKIYDIRHPGRDATLLLQRPSSMPGRADRQFHRSRSAIRLGHPFRRRSCPARPGHQRRRHARRAAVRALRSPLQHHRHHRRHRHRPGTVRLRRLRKSPHLHRRFRDTNVIKFRLAIPLHRPPCGP